MRKLLTLSSLAGLVFAGTAAAASAANISVSLQPDKVKKNSTLTITASGFPAETSLPTSAEFQVQKGFKTSVKSVKTLCNPNGSSCPAASKVGSGTAQVTASVGALVVPATVELNLYLGKPLQAGDIASVVVIGSTVYDGTTYTATGSGRLFKDAAGGLELLFTKFPTVQNLPPSVSVTLNSLSLTAGKIRTVTRHHKQIAYSLITNPSTCSGHWTGSGTVTFPNESVSQSVSTACRS